MVYSSLNQFICWYLRMKEPERLNFMSLPLRAVNENYVMVGRSYLKRRPAENIVEEIDQQVDEIAPGDLKSEGQKDAAKLLTRLRTARTVWDAAINGPMAYGGYELLQSSDYKPSAALAGGIILLGVAVTKETVGVVRSLTFGKAALRHKRSVKQREKEIQNLKYLFRESPNE
jgi:hypothetical protein